MRLAVHFQGLPGDLRDKVQSSNMGYVKLIDPPSDNPFPGKRVIGRTFMDDNEANALANRGAEGAQIWFGRFLPIYKKATYIWAWEGPNEPQPIADYGFRKNLNLFTDALAELMHGGGLRIVGLNLGVGGPDIGHAKDFPCVANCDYLGLHEYSARAMWDGASWYCLRYRRMLEELQAAHISVPPVLIGECGVDGGVLIPGQRTGWKTFCQPANGKSSEQVYEEQLAWYDGELQRDGATVAAAFIFTAGANGDWQDFDLNATLVDWLCAKSWEVEAPVLPPVVPPVNPPVQPPVVIPPTPVNPQPALVNLVGKLPAHPTNHYRTRKESAINKIVIHHSGPPGALPITTAEYCRRIAANEVRKGNPGASYHFVIGTDGTIAQVNELTTISYHAAQYNSHSIGVCLLGDFRQGHDEEPTEAQLESLNLLTKYLLARVKMTKNIVWAHRQLMRTDCPGGGWYEDWRRTLA